ncbi:MAG TPA: TIGR00266 family protein [Methanothrix sp.]|mgnify:CR=1 FL=1|nr:TIGR00266 family protein [Methanothrix sp.]HOK57404.1 TIGR00266 family protein [Methanothrix sp.]HOL42741.1 TIGR00266 family protein [Methanothrix sp.]HPO87690.1 TIGR00266 family protein [Methanothrix sp.]
MSLRYTILGDDLQVLEVQLAPGESIRSEAGAMLFMDEGMDMSASTGGIIKGLKRAVAGEGLFITSFTNRSDDMKRMAFSAPFPGKILSLNLDDFGGQLLCQRGAFLCGESGVEIEVAFTKRLGAGFFGGEGFVLQRLRGRGMVFIHAGGALITRDLREGEVINVDTGCLVAFSRDVDYDIRFVGGVRNALFGGEGIFLARLTGPGRVYLQSLPLSRLADRILQGKVVSSKSNTD